jgi:DNA polymerase III sliding clamp (beta) subunit (PCNA family)
MLNKLKFLLAGISENESRKNLMVIDCNVIDQKLYMMSADGFCIKTVECTTDLHDCHFYIDLDSVKKIVKIAKKSDHIDIKEDQCSIGNIDINYQFTINDFDYPDLSKLLNSDFTDSIEYMAINPTVLQNALKFAPENKTTVFRFAGYGKPIKVDFGKDNIGYNSYIMPVRIDW